MPELIPAAPGTPTWECLDCGWTCGPTVIDNPECDNCGGELEELSERNRAARDA